jgi:hypothetical protein
MTRARRISRGMSADFTENGKTILREKEKFRNSISYYVSYKLLMTFECKIHKAGTLVAL